MTHLDSTKLIEAIEIKLTAQWDFVLWWDLQERQHGELGNRSVTQFERLENFYLRGCPRIESLLRENGFWPLLKLVFRIDAVRLVFQESDIA